MIIISKPIERTLICKYFYIADCAQFCSSERKVLDGYYMCYKPTHCMTRNMSEPWPDSACGGHPEQQCRAGEYLCHNRAGCYSHEKM